MRVPIGPEFNPATAIGLLNRPEVSTSEHLLANFLSLNFSCVGKNHAVDSFCLK